jgi:hypothetical protein
MPIGTIGTIGGESDIHPRAFSLDIEEGFDRTDNGFTDYSQVVEINNLSPILLSAKEVVHVDTIDKFKFVMSLYRHIGLKFGSEDPLGPSLMDTFNIYKDRSCLLAVGNGTSIPVAEGEPPHDINHEIEYCDSDYYASKGMTIVSFEDFCARYKITQDNLAEFNTEITSEAVDNTTEAEETTPEPQSREPVTEAPFFFYVDWSRPENSGNTNARRFARWLSALTEGPSSSSDPYFFSAQTTGYSGVGMPNNRRSTAYGAFYTSERPTEDYLVEIIIDEWFDLVRPQTFTAIGDKNADGAFDYVTLSRNEVAPIRFFDEFTEDVYTIASGAKELPLCDIQFIKKKGDYSFHLRGGPYVSIDGSDYPHLAKVELLEEGVIFQCEYTGNLSFMHEQQEAVSEHGELARVSSYHTSLLWSDAENTYIVEHELDSSGYIYHDGDYILESNLPIKYNADYHELDREWACERGTPFTIGFEIEKIDAQAYESVNYEDLYEENNWIKEDDSSLKDEDGRSAYGFELVSPVYDLMSDQLDKDIEESENLQNLINADYNSTSCGGHINIGSTVYSPIQIFYGLKGFFPLLYSLYNFRLENSNDGTQYSKGRAVHEYTKGTQWDDGGGGHSYSAFELKNHVLEMRLVAAVRDVDNLLWRRDLLRIMMQHINKSEKEVLSMMLNERSLLFKHLKKVYKTEGRYMQKCEQFVSMCEIYNHVKLPKIDWDKYKNKSK